MVREQLRQVFYKNGSKPYLWRIEMYESHWQLSQKPFEPNSDDRFYFNTPGFAAALMKLRYGIESHRALAALTGPSGVGKTRLTLRLEHDLSESYRPVIHVRWPNLELGDLISLLVQEWGNQTGEWTAESAIEISLGEATAQLAELVQKNVQAGRHGLVVLDEADSLEQVPTLLELLQTESAEPAATLLLVGQPTLLTRLSRDAQLVNQLDTSALVKAFSAEETAAYVEHRLLAAGAPWNVFESPEALDALFEHTAGVARRINRLADMALFAGFGEEATSISRPLVESVANELTASFA